MTRLAYPARRRAPSLLSLGRAALGKHGYEDIKRMTVKARHSALTQAAREYGWTAVLRVLRAKFLRARSRDTLLASMLREDGIFAGAKGGL